MTSLLIEGGEPLRGSVPISGAKNAALPACVATLLTEESVILHAVPQLRDVSTILYMLGALGKRVVRHEANVSIASGGSLIPEANAYSVGQMRASFLVLGPLVARLGRAVVPLPGGCAIGARPVDLHSVGATEQIMMAACLAAGETNIHNAATEPEVMDLIDLLTKMGAAISVTDRTIHIEGQQSLGGAEHTLIPDRMEAGTLLLSPVRPEHLQAFLDSLKATGLEVEVDGSTITSRSLGPTKATEIVTSPYPGFPTDLHPPMAAYLATAVGRSSIVETVFERRFAYTREYSRRGGPCPCWIGSKGSNDY